MAKGNLVVILGEVRQWEDTSRGANFIGFGAPLFKFGWGGVLYIVIQIFMRPSGVYLVEVELGTWRSTAIPQGDLQITLRIGRNSTFLNYAQPHSSSSVNFNSTLQLNVDSMALDTQRCSLTLNTATGDKKVLGIALVSLPKDKNTIQNTYKLTQSEDKKAEIDIKIRIAPLEPYSNPQKSTIQPQESQNYSVSKESSSVEQEAKAGNNNNKIYTGSTYRIDGASNASSIRLKSKNSQAGSQGGGDTDSKTNLKTYKIREVDRVIQISESELKRFKDEKEAYYQMYQIQKSKNQMASKFISSVIKKLAEKYPGLVSSISDISTGTPQGSKRLGDAQTDRNKSTKSTITQDPAALEQANRSLHRQIEEYKRIVDQLKSQLSRGGQAYPSKVNDNGINLNPFRPNLLPPNILNDFGPSPSRFNSNIKSVISTPPPPPAPTTPSVPAPKICEVDLKKWLEQSVGQRSELQSTFSALPVNTKQQSNEKQPNLRKTKVSIDRAFSTLLSKKDITKQALLSHKQQINRIFDEIASY